MLTALLRIIHLLGGISLFFCSCSPAVLGHYDRTRQDSHWVRSDLRLLETVDAPVPTADIIAAYFRKSDTEMEIRLDLLEVHAGRRPDIYLALDLVPGGSNWAPIPASLESRWDMWIIIPAYGSPFVQNNEGTPVSEMIPRTMWNTHLDTLVVSLNPAFLPGNGSRFWFMAFSTLTRETSLADMTLPVYTLGNPPEPANLLLAFTDTLPAATPAQTLRRWNGAHTGPNGGRHGLQPLISAASSANVPVFLLDLKRPESLAGLDALQAIQEVRTLQALGLITIPDTPMGDLAYSQARRLSQEVVRAFEFLDSYVYFGKDLPVGLGQYAFAFADLNDPSHIVTWDDYRLVPLPTQTNYPRIGFDPNTQATPEGLAQTSVEILLDVALSQDPDDLVVLGGDLFESTWGDDAAAQATFGYIKNHPWIQPLSLTDIQTLSPTESKTVTSPLRCQTAVCEKFDKVASTNPSMEIAARLESIPPGPLVNQAWEAFFRYTDTLQSIERQNLGLTYLSQINALLLAAEWEQIGQIATGCGFDVDQDRREDCILSNDSWLLILSRTHAGILYGFMRLSSGVQQVIGPTYQIAPGLSDPEQWNFHDVLTADPMAVPGAFLEPKEGGNFEVKSNSADSILFISPESRSTRQFTLNQTGIKIEYSSDFSSDVQIPLLLLPKEGYASGWYHWYESHSMESGWGWSLVQGPQVIIKASIPLELHSFLEALPFLTRPEDPDTEFPPGHFVPFPFAIVSGIGRGNFQIAISASE